MEDRYVFCGTCRKHLKHNQVQNFVYSFEELEEKEETDEVELITHVSEASILQCNRCQTLCFRLAQITDNQVPFAIEYYPAFYTWQLSTNIELADAIPNEISLIYKELLSAFNSSLLIAAGTLVGTLLERICDDKGMDESTLFKKIDALPIEGQFKEVLHNLRDLRNTAVHKAYQGSRKEIGVAIKVMELLLSKFYYPSAKILEYGRLLEDFKSKRR